MSSDVSFSNYTSPPDGVTLRNTVAVTTKGGVKCS